VVDGTLVVLDALDEVAPQPARAGERQRRDDDLVGGEGVQRVRRGGDGSASPTSPVSSIPSAQEVGARSTRSWAASRAASS
jgi:hypothetical protein